MTDAERDPDWTIDVERSPAARVVDPRLAALAPELQAWLRDPSVGVEPLRDIEARIRTCVADGATADDVADHVALPLESARRVAAGGPLFTPLATPDRIDTERLRLTVLQPDDALDLFTLLGAAGPHLTGPEPLADVDAVSTFVARRRERRGDFGLAWYTARDRADSLVGLLGSSIRRTGPEPEFAFEIHPAHRERGYGREAATALVTALHRAGVQRVWATVRASNGASLRALAAAGFARTRPRGGWPDRGPDLVYLTAQQSVAPAG